MRTVRLVLDSEITPKNDTVVVLGDVSLLPPEGFLYFEEGQDFLHYGAISGNTLTGVSELALCHEAGESLVDFYGVLPSTILAGIETTTDSDPDGVAATIISVMDDSYKEYMRLRRYLRSVNSPLFCEESLIGDMVKFLGVDYITLCEDSARKRALSLWASYLVSKRGSAEAFNTLVYLVTGVFCTTRLIDKFVPLEMDSSYGILIDSAQYLPADRNTLGLWYMEEGAGVTIENVMDTPGLTDGTITDAAMWDTTLGCSLFDKHINLEFSGAGELLTIPSGRGQRTFLGAKRAFSLQLILKGKGGGAYPQVVLDKSGMFRLTRLDETTLTFEVTNGVDTISYTLPNAINNSGSSYLAFLFNEDGLSIVLNYEVIAYNLGDGFNLVDSESSIRFGDAVSGFHGSVDMFKLGNGEEKVSDFLRWYEPLWYLLSSLTEEDLTNYFFSEYSVYNTVEVTLTDYTGTEGELSYIRDLAHIWLGAGKIIIHPAGNYLINSGLGII